MRHATGGSPLHFFFRRNVVNFFFLLLSEGGRGIFSSSVGGGEAGKKAKMTLDAGGKSVSEKSQATPGLQEPHLEIKK